MNELKLSLNSYQNAALNMFCELLQMNTKKVLNKVEVVESVLFQAVSSYITLEFGGQLCDAEMSQVYQDFIESVM